MERSEGNVASLAFPTLPQQEERIPFGQPEARMPETRIPEVETIEHFHTNRQQWLNFQGLGFLTYGSLIHDPNFAI